MAGMAADNPHEQGPVLDELRGDPRPAVSRAALAAQHPGWGLATMSLLVIGLLVGFVSLGPLGRAVDACAFAPERLVCAGRMHAVVVALPVAALVAGLTVALVGGRLVLRRGRSPVGATILGWALFLLGTAAAYLLAAR